MTDLQKTFKEETTKKLMDDLKLKNPMAVPKITKIVVNTSTRDFLVDKKKPGKGGRGFGYNYRSES